MKTPTPERPLLGARNASLLLGAAFALAIPAVHALPAPTQYQAENATISQGAVQSSFTGFSGSGYVNPNDVAGSSVQWTVNVPAAGRYNVSYRYANGSTTRRPMRMEVINGLGTNTVTERLPGEPTRSSCQSNDGTGTPSWTVWCVEGIQVELQAGSNGIRLTSLTSNGGPNIDRLEVSAQQPAATADWSRMVVDSTRARMPGGVGVWEYSRALFLYGTYLTWRRVGNGDLSHPYMTYIRNWVNSHVSSSGTIDRAISNLDNMLPGNLCLLMARHFPSDSRYRNCANNVRAAFNGYPKVEGGYMHSKSASRECQLWLDGVFMAMPFRQRNGVQFGDSNETTASHNDAANQLDIYADRTRRPTGLLRHAWWGGCGDNPGWADGSGQSPEHWCRALGWFGITHIEVLELLPTNHAKRPELIATLTGLVNGLVANQDPLTGMFYQVVDKRSVLENWEETSCTSMHAYTILRAVEKGYVADPTGSIRAAAQKAHDGVLTKVYIGTDDRTNVTNISRGTNVSNASYYYNRVRPLNDMHGLGAFLIMKEAFNGNAGWNFTPGPDPEPGLVDNLSNKDTANPEWSVQTGLAVGNQSHGDRAYTFGSIPASVAGSEWIRSAADSKGFTGNPLVTFDLTEAATVYVAIDDRVGRRPWMDASWVDTGENLTVNEPTVRTYSLFSKSFTAAGPVSLGPQASTTAPNYMVIVK